ncbi:MAG: peptide chain release factor H [Clostridia bacterium]|nr:peptide chain release factor H [Clostridia bacterium]
MIYQISSGQGPAECELGVAKLLEYLQKNYKVTVLDFSEGCHDGTYRSVRILSPDDLSAWVGSVQWIWQSTYRPKHKRKNWFLDFSVCPLASAEKFDEKQIVFETFRSGGNGGQNVNKVETGVRAIYTPNGLSAVCTEERSQYQNKQRAIEKLKAAILLANAEQEAKAANDAWKRHTQIIRGGAAHKFCGSEFTEIV